jgi:DNA modification methylase
VESVQFKPTKCWLVWDKQNGTNDFADCELAWTNYPIAVRRKYHLWNGMIRKGHEERFHPTQKPKEVMSWAIGLSPESNTVLDPFLGSGTTLIACKELNRNGIGIEISEKYCEIAKNRLRATCKPLFTDVSSAKKSSKKENEQEDTLFPAG